MTTLPEDTFYVVPLEAKVLLPSIVVRVILRGKDATALVRTHFRLQEHHQKSLQLACIPLLPKQQASPVTVTAAVQEAPLAPEPVTERQPQQKEDQALVPWENRARLFAYGCIGKIVRVQRLSVGAYGVYIEGLSRFKVVEYGTHDQLLTVSVGLLKTPDQSQIHKEEILTFKALAQKFISKMKDLQVADSLIQQLQKLLDMKPAHTLADMLVSVIETSFNEKLMMLETEDPNGRLIKASEWLTRQLQVLKISDQMQSAVEGNLTKKQREFYLKQQLEDIKKELGNNNKSTSSSQQHYDNDEDDIAHLSRRIAEAKLPNDALTVAQRELARLKRLPSSSTEWAVSRNYLELLAEMPWNNRTEDILDIASAKAQLDGDHVGLDHVKKRIVEYLSVAKIKGDLKAPILCFVGPPGVGKTSLGKSIATALGRKFHRVSLGGVHDEADIRGHRRTYVGAMPGLIIQGIKRSGVKNPVFLLDEVDKVARSSHHGDPSAALLEVLDPEQNSTFQDHFLNVPFDLSGILFIATANSLSTIPEPLLDRMEVIELHGYTFEEKLHIARTHLLPKQISQHGLRKHHIDLSDALLLQLAEQYTRESGVRNLERILGAIVRGKCVELATLRESNREQDYQPVIQQSDLISILGRPAFENDLAERQGIAGVVTGLAYSGSGQGGILFIESTKTPGSGELRLTGSLGDVMQESAQIALTWLKAHAYDLKLTLSRFENIVHHYDVHIHVPHGSVPKEGPSAGIALVCSLVSLFSGRSVPPTTAMTGEISLRGQVLPVGGIKEKIISAHRAGIRTIIIPHRNLKDVEADVPDSVKSQVTFVYAKTIMDVLQAATLIDVIDSKADVPRSLESRL